ncbi:hypothetical protein [Bradyrhizobium elkanii]|uniref:hypothetical protein n=1 Tax=Bradyrhizobium elkanii TaxID=29448 RepID=UPI00272D6A14|nr:hypothetical protein [Bradyrhizobium elkanii]WLA79005.1 hypothetical protein QNJ99_26710 [Bradyrhizobium elkanii]
MSTQTAGEKFGVKGRRTIRKSSPTSQNGRHVGFWELEAKPGTMLARLEKSYLAALDTVDAVEAHKVAAASSGKFTSEGLKADVLSFAAARAPSLKRGRQQIAAAKRELDDLRGRISLDQQTDKADAVGYLRRLEIRGFLAGMNDEKRNQYLSKNRDSLPTEWVQAITEMPAIVSGILDTDHKFFVDRELKRLHGDTLKEVEDLQRGIEVAERAIEMAREEIIRDAEATPIQFNQAAAPHEAKAGVAWLRKELGRVVVVDLESRIGRQPTPEELETGVFFANYEDYASSNGIQIDRTAA